MKIKLHINWKKTLIVVLDLILAVYLGFAMTSFRKPDETMKMCTKVNINITDENTYGFLSAQEIKKLLEKEKLYPLQKQMADINPRSIEDVLKESSFVSTAQCFKTQDGHVSITVTQRLPIVRIKSIDGEDYYVDDKGGIMASSSYVSDLIIATGYIDRDFARQYLAFLNSLIMDNEFWKDQIEQINVMPDKGIELVPRVGDHIVFLGYLPMEKDKAKREKMLTKYVVGKLQRLEKFYKYGLSQAGWNKYHYISLEYDNQIICKRKARDFPLPEPPKAAPDSTATAAQQPVMDEVIEVLPGDTAKAKTPKESPQKKEQKETTEKKQEQKKQS